MKYLIFIFLFFHSLSAYELCVCAIFQNEAPYLKEWIEYHKLLGVEHFYLYNDRSQDNYQEVLNPYILRGLVTLTDCFPQNQETHFSNQRRAHVRGLNAARCSTRWLAFIDIDEFIVPKNVDTVLEMLKPYENDLGVVIRWIKFGTSGFWELPQDKLMIECLTKTSPREDEDNFVTKSIIQLAFLPEEFFDEEFVVARKIDLVHFRLYAPYDGCKSKAIGYISHDGKEQKCLTYSEAQINHYWCRDEKYYREQKVFRKAWLLHEDFGRPYPWSDAIIEKYLNLYNSCEDQAIARFATPLKDSMSREL